MTYMTSSILTTVGLICVALSSSVGVITCNEHYIMEKYEKYDKSEKFIMNVVAATAAGVMTPVFLPYKINKLVRKIRN